MNAVFVFAVALLLVSVAQASDSDKMLAEANVVEEVAARRQYRSISYSQLKRGIGQGMGCNPNRRRECMNDTNCLCENCLDGCRYTCC